MEEDRGIILIKEEEYEDMKKQLRDNERIMSFYKQKYIQYEEIIKEKDNIILSYEKQYKEKIKQILDKEKKYIRDICSCLD